MSNYFDEHLPKRVLLAIVCSILFMAIPRILFDGYFKYFDEKQYYMIVQPIPINKKWYKPCEDVQITATVNSLINTNLDVRVELILRKNENTILKVLNATIDRRTIAREGRRQTILVEYPLPCTLKDGLYYWQILVRYETPAGYERSYLAITDTFNVNKYGTDPELIKAATKAASFERISQGIFLPSPAPIKNYTYTAPTNEKLHLNGTDNNLENKNQSPPQPTPEQNSSPVKEFLDDVSDDVKSTVDTVKSLF